MSSGPPSEGRYSPDGNWWWDGSKWVPATAGRQAPVAQLQPPPNQAPGVPVAAVYVQGARTNSLAVASLVTGIISWFMCPVLGGVLAVIFGHVARGQIRRTGESGSGLAVAGLVLGYAHLAAAAVLIGFWILLFGGMAAVIGTLPLVSPSP